MIENIRKYNILIIIGLVVIAAGLVITMQTGGGRGLGGNPYIKVGARTYTDNEYRQLGVDGLQIARTFSQSDLSQAMRMAGYDQQLTRLILNSGPFPTYQFIDSLAPRGMFLADSEDKTEQFFINRMIVRGAKAEFGIHPSDEQINDFIRNLPTFMGAKGEFDQEIYARYIEKGLGRLGMGERDLRELISDIIATRHLRAIVSSGLSTHPNAIAAQNALDMQKISGSAARLELAPFKETIKPTDEELKTYWELIQDAFKTEEQRRFSYILVAPEKVDEQAATEEDNKPSLAEAAMTDEQKAAAAKEKAEKEAARAVEIAEAKRKAQNKINAAFDEFIIELENKKGANFEELAATEDYQWEVVDSGLFTRTNPPEELDLTVRNNSGGGNVADQLFRMITTTDPLSKFSQPMPVGENQWLVARLDETIAARVKTFEEAKEQIREQYIEEHSTKALEKAMKEAAEKIASSLSEGKSFTEAANAAGIKEIEPFEDTETNQGAPKPFLPFNLSQLARTIEPGKISEPVLQSDRVYLIHVSKREIIEGTNDEGMLVSQANIAMSNNAAAAFADWLKHQNESANIERFYTP